MAASGVVVFDAEPGMVLISEELGSEFLVVDPARPPALVVLDGDLESDLLIITPGGPLGPVGPQGVQGPVGPQGTGAAEVLEALDAHINNPTPHPAYDDIQSLVLVFENGLI